MPMKKYLLALALCALSPRLATAQEVKNPVVLEKVTYSRAVPKGLRAFVPRGGKSRFWGATKLQFEGKQVWVHFYDVRKAKVSKDKETNLFGTQKSGLDLFTLSSSRRLKRISSTRFDYKRFDVVGKGFGSQPVGAETLWLDPKIQKMPIIRIILAGTRGFIAEDESILVVFDQKFKNSIVQQGFSSGRGGGGGGGYQWITSFDETDEKGLLSIGYSYFNDDGTDIIISKWNGKAFVISSREHRASEQ